MSQYGSTFATAELITQNLNTYRILTDSDDDITYFKFSVETLINETTVTVISLAFPNYSFGTSLFTVTLYDSSEVELETISYASNTQPVIYTNLAIGEYFIKLDWDFNNEFLADVNIDIINDGNNIVDNIVDLPAMTTNDLVDVWNIGTLTNIDDFYKFYTDEAITAHTTIMHVFGKHRTSEFYISQVNQDVNNINGIVNFNGVPESGKVVRLYRKESGQMMDETISNDLGEYKFNVLLTADKYYVIAFDDMLNPVYQAMALDNLTPKTVKLQ